MCKSRQHRDFDNLALRMAALEETAFDEFGREFGPRLWAYFGRLGLTPADAESLAVTCITEVAMKAAHYSPREQGSFMGWVYKIAYHQLVDWKRQNPHTFDEAVVLDQLIQPDSPPESSGSDSVTTHPCLYVAVHEALNDLPELDRRIVELRDFGGGYSYEEVGNILRISPGTARVRHHRAYRKLERILSDFPAIQQCFGLSNDSNNLLGEEHHVRESVSN